MQFKHTVPQLNIAMALFFLEFDRPVDTHELPATGLHPGFRRKTKSVFKTALTNISMAKYEAERGYQRIEIKKPIENIKDNAREVVEKNPFSQIRAKENTNALMKTVTINLQQQKM